MCLIIEASKTARGGPVLSRLAETRPFASDRTSTDNESSPLYQSRDTNQHKFRQKRSSRSDESTAGPICSEGAITVESVSDGSARITTESVAPKRVMTLGRADAGVRIDPMPLIREGERPTRCELTPLSCGGLVLERIRGTVEVAESDLADASRRLTGIRDCG